VGAIVAGTQGLSKVNDFPRVKVADGTGTVNLKAGNHVAYYEAPNINDNSKSVPVVGVALQSPSGKVMTLHTLYGARSDGKVKILTYEYNGHNGIALYQFKLTESGRYRVALQAGSQASPDADIALGTSIAKGLAIGAALIIPGVLLLVAAIVLLIVGLVKRSRHNKELAAVGPYGGYSGYGGAPPAGGYPPPGGYQQPGSYPPPGGYPPPSSPPPNNPPQPGQWQPPSQ
jgi:hypothetical protein